MATVTRASRELFVNRAPVLNFCGVIHWSCPNCGKINSNRMNYTAWRIRCTQNNCRRWWLIGKLRKCPPGYGAYWRSHRTR
jgi:hypothetical protein